MTDEMNAHPVEILLSVTSVSNHGVSQYSKGASDTEWWTGKCFVL